MVPRMLSWLGLRKPKPTPQPAIAPEAPAPGATVSAATAPGATTPHAAAPDETAPEAIAQEHPTQEAAHLAPNREPAPTQPDLDPTHPIAGHTAPQPDPTQAPPPANTQRTELESLIAEARFAEAETRFALLPPDLEQEWYVRAGLALARRRADHTQALAYATRLQALTPSTPLAYAAASQALRALARPREALAAAEAGLQNFPKATGLLQEAAQAAEAAGNTDRAYATLAALRAAQPKSSEGYVRAVQLSLRRRHPEITRTLLAEGLATFPDDRSLRLAAAREAAGNQAWPEAAAHWSALTTLFPEDASLALEAALSVIGLRSGRLERMPQVLAGLAAVRRRFPDFAPAYAAEIKVLREAGRLDEAEAKGKPWRERFPASQDVAMACARVAEEQGRPEEAVRMLEAARAGAEPGPLLEAAYLRSLSLAGQDEAAERATDAALVRFPQDIRIIRQHVTLASRRGDSAEAAARARRLAQRFPHNAAITKLARRQAAEPEDDNDHTLATRTAHKPS